MRNRKSLRAAAMVEAAVVIPVMISFLAGIGLMKNGYDRKIIRNQQVRSQVLDYASHNCQSQTISYSDTSRGTGAGAALPTGSGGNADANGGIGTVGSPASSGFMAKAEVSYQTSSVTPIRSGIRNGRGLSLRVNGAKSVALCNEEPRDGNLSGLFGYAKGLLSSKTGR